MTALSDADLQILRHARTFPPTTYRPKHRSAKKSRLSLGGSLVLGDRTVSPDEMRETVERLAAAGYLEQHGAPYDAFDADVEAQPYRVTDVGRRVARNGSDITIDQARIMHARDLIDQYGDHSVARRQLELREAGAAIVRGVLRTVGASSYGNDWTGYSGTSGWHVTAYMTTERQIGFVNMALGNAVLTDATLEAEIAEALTVPQQSEGVLASGAAAWSAPDVGMSQPEKDSDGVVRLAAPKKESGPEAPRGWVQLVLDLRGTAEPVPCRAHVCAWGLRTCYEGRRGGPGAQHLDGHQHPPMFARDWPLTSEQITRLRIVGEPILRRMAEHLADIAGCRDEVVAELDRPNISAGARVDAAIRALGAYDWHSGAYDAANATRSVIYDVARSALRAAGVGRISAISGDANDVGGMQYWDLCAHLLERIVIRDLTPVAEALWSSAMPHVARGAAPASPGTADPVQWHLHQQVVGPAIAEIAKKFAGEVLRNIVRRDHPLGTDLDYAALCDALYAEGYVEVNVPITIG
jgi:hypothetical protein